MPDGRLIQHRMWIVRDRAKINAQIPICSKNRDNGRENERGGESNILI